MDVGGGSLILSIVGSRDYPALDQVTEFVVGLPSGTVIVSGGARGVDRQAVAAGNAFGFRTHTIPALWNTYGKRAGFIRNQLLVDTCQMVVAFWDLESRGTLDTIRKALRAHRPVWVFTQED